MLRPYQIEAIRLVRERINEKPVLCLPTGSGKTTVAAQIIKNAVEGGNSCIFLVHRRELVSQAVDRLQQFGIEAGIIAAGTSPSAAMVQVASIPTLVKRDHVPADLVLIDECAHSPSKSWREVIDRYDGSWLLGLTATPVRLSGEPLGDVFGCIVEPVTMEELIEQGYLIEPTVWAPAVDLSDVPIRFSEYSLPVLVERMDKLTGDIVEHWKKHARGLKTVAFTCNVAHSINLVSRFRDAGVRAAHLDGTTPMARRDEILTDLRNGKLDLVSSIMVLSEGFDLPELNCAIIARPTKSLALHRQMIGRIVRPPGPAIVLDHAGNHNEHGSVTDHIEWSLDGEYTREGVKSLRSCPECYRILPADATVCVECGYDTEQPSARDQQQLDEAEAMLVEFQSVKSRRRVYIDWLELASERLYRLTWARLQHKQTYGKWPKFAKLEAEHYKCPGHKMETSTNHWGEAIRRCHFCRVTE